ncbi:MAK10-like protein [Tanacetum coccineum]
MNLLALIVSMAISYCKSISSRSSDQFVLDPLVQVEEELVWLASKHIYSITKLLYLDSTIFPDLRVLRHRPALRSWNTTTMKKMIKMETDTRCLGKLEHHGEFDPEEEQDGMNVYKGLDVYVPPINDKEPEPKEEYYEKIILKFDIISDERSELSSKDDDIKVVVDDGGDGGLKEYLVSWFVKPKSPKTPTLSVLNELEALSGPHDTQYCMEDPEQAFVEYASSRTDEAGGKLGDSEPFNTLADLGSCVNIIPLYLFKKLNIGLLEETDHIFGLANGTKSYPIGIVKDVEVNIGNLKLLNDFYVIDMKKDLEPPLLVGRGFLATTNAVIDCRVAKIAVGEGITRSVFRVKGVDLSGEEEIARDVKLNPFKDTLVFRRMVEFLGAIPINLKSNMWELEDLIKNPINWDKPPKDKDRAWHAKIRLIDLGGEEFTKTLQSIPTTRNLSEREIPREIIDLDHFYNT